MVKQQIWIRNLQYTFGCIINLPMYPSTSQIHPHDIAINVPQARAISGPRDGE